MQTTENSEKRVVEIQQTKLNSHYRQNSIHTTDKSKLQNIGNPDRKEVKVMPQIILHEWKIIFSGSLLHKTPTPWVRVGI